MNECPKCLSTKIVGIEYDYSSKYRYDGVSEWMCQECNYRQGRWCGRPLEGKEVEGPFCEGVKPHPIVVNILEEDGNR